MTHVVAMKCLIGLPLLIHIEISRRSQSRSRKFCVPTPQPCHLQQCWFFITSGSPSYKQRLEILLYKAARNRHGPVMQKEYNRSQGPSTLVAPSHRLPQSWWTATRHLPPKFRRTQIRICFMYRRKLINDSRSLWHQQKWPMDGSSLLA
jgi:hypothetical protein